MNSICSVRFWPAPRAGVWALLCLLATTPVLAGPAAIPTTRDSDISVAGVVNDAMGPGVAYFDSAADMTLGGHFVDTVDGFSISPTGDHVVSSKAIQDSELILGVSDVYGTFLRGGRAAGSAFGIHEIFGPTPGGGPAIADSFFDVFFTVGPLDVARFAIDGIFEGHGDAEAILQLNKLGMGPPVAIFDEVAAFGAFSLSATATLGPGTYHLSIGAHADGLPGGSGSEYDFRFTTPEPGSGALALLGVAGVFWLRRRSQG